jgi:hypothetical protein
LKALLSVSRLANSAYRLVGGGLLCDTLTDPEGKVRVFEEHLGRGGDGLLLAPSPPEDRVVPDSEYLVFFDRVRETVDELFPPSRFVKAYPLYSVTVEA